MDSWSTKALSTLGVLLHLLFIAIPADLYRWLTLRRRRVKGRTVVITGGASGIGRGLAHNFAVELRARVAIIDINKAGAEETVAEIVEQGGDAWAWSCDISKEKDLNEVAREIEKYYGKVDIVICNAAVLHFGYFMELTMEQIRQAMDVNVIGTINTIRAFLGDMETRNEGQIVAVSSIAGFAGETYGLAYCPTKFAIRGVMESLQMELRDRGLDGIHCTTVCPYFVRTPMIARLGMRPTSTWFPFMSVNSCTRRIVDAILKRKVLAFMPNYVNLIANVKVLLSYHTAKALREYLNCRYEPTKSRVAAAAESTPDAESTRGQTLRTTRSLQPAMADYFARPSLFWWVLIVPALAINFLAYYRVELLAPLPYVGPLTADLAKNTPWVLIATNIFAAAAHFLEAVCAFSVATDLKYSFATKAKWFLQTFVIGFPSLRLILAARKKSAGGKGKKRN